MAKLVYEKPSAELVRFDNSDVITTSPPGGGGDSGKDCTGKITKTTSDGKCIWFGVLSLNDDDEDAW